MKKLHKYLEELQEFNSNSKYLNTKSQWHPHYELEETMEIDELINYFKSKGFTIVEKKIVTWIKLEKEIKNAIKKYSTPVLLYDPNINTVRVFNPETFKVNKIVYCLDLYTKRTPRYTAEFIDGNDSRIQQSYSFKEIKEILETEFDL